MNSCTRWKLLVLAAAVCVCSFAQDAKKESKPPSEAEMMAAMMELAKPGENHKMLAKSIGNWTYEMKWWTDSKSPPIESSGTTVTKEVMGGRYFTSEHSGTTPVPGPDGKIVQADFKGLA